VKVVLHPQADAEFLLAQQRYADVSPALGRRLYDEITSVFRRVVEHPAAYTFCFKAQRLPFSEVEVEAIQYQTSRSLLPRLCTDALSLTKQARRRRVSAQDTLGP
jgi:hypothetical protein